MPRNFVNATLKESHYYADGTSGSDLNDGLTALTPKKTLQAVADIVPYSIVHNTAVHLSGTFSNNNCAINKNVKTDVFFVIDGGKTFTALASSLTATGSSITSLTVSGASWTIDQWKGYGIEIISGSQIGHVRYVFSNTADTLVIGRDFAADPGTCNFNIVEPATKLVGSTSYSLLNGCTGAGQVIIQNLKLESGYRIQNITDVYVVWISGILCNHGTMGGHYNRAANWLYFYNQYYDIATGWDTTFRLVCASVGATASTPIYNLNVRALSAIGGVFQKFSAFSCGIWIMASGCRWTQVDLRGCKNLSIDWSTFQHLYSNFRKPLISGSTAAGIWLYDSEISFNDITVQNSASHGIHIENGSVANFQGPVDGAGNGGVGLYAHQGSQVEISSSSPPTVTGTLGDVAVNSTTQPTTWANIVSNGGLSSAQEATTVKVS